MILIKSESNEYINSKRTDYYVNLIVSLGFKIKNNELRATKCDYLKYHSSHYIRYLTEYGANGGNIESASRDSSEGDSNSDISTENDIGMDGADSGDHESYGCIDDCFLFPGILNYISNVTGGTLYGAQQLLKYEPSIESSNWVAIHWDGGRHHAKLDRASGFCHVNDIVLAILALKEKYNTVLYIDLDIHHGDGVQEAFQYTPSVTTLSIHLIEPGFFPGTGQITEIGFGRAKYKTINIPLSRGLSSHKFTKILATILPRVVAKIRPDCFVVQCGCDGLSKDPLGMWNLDTDAYARILSGIVNFKIPTLVLGGGGYNSINAARCWAKCTIAISKVSSSKKGDCVAEYEQVCVGDSEECFCFKCLSIPSKAVPLDVPEENPDWPLYGPDYTLETSTSNMVDMNTDTMVKDTIEFLLENINKISL